MAQLASSIKNTVERMSVNDKHAQLLRHTVDPAEAASGKYITSMHGVRVANTDTWLKASDPTHGGPALLEDFHALEKIQRFDHERIPERSHILLPILTASADTFSTSQNCARSWCRRTWLL